MVDQSLQAFQRFATPIALDKQQRRVFTDRSSTKFFVVEICQQVLTAGYANTSTTALGPLFGQNLTLALALVTVVLVL